jgi:hypothetical protein
MFYLNQLINAVYNIFSNDKNTLIGNDNDPLEISENHNVHNVHKTLNYTTLKETMGNAKKCDCNHQFGYSPFHKDGHCRFCWGLNPNN